MLSKVVIQIINITDCGFKVLPSKAKWCKTSVDRYNLCLGEKVDCINKAKEMCQTESNCYGFMWNDQWGETNQGVKMCTSLTLIEKPDKDWEIYLKKCIAGMTVVLNVKSI